MISLPIPARALRPNVTVRSRRSVRKLPPLKKEAAAKEEEAEKNRSKKVSVFKRWVDNVMNMGESFFEERDENGQDSAN